MNPATEAEGLAVGQLMDGRYQIEQQLGEGGMGVVYRARHVHLNKPVAIKLVRSVPTPELRQRFLREAQAASMISHPNIVSVNDYGVLPSGHPYLVMEYLAGQTLSKLIKAGSVLPLRTCRIARQIALGLLAAHDKQIVHRDLKPDNIFLLEEAGASDIVKIVDFGIARVLTATQLTVTGALMGTPQYLPPEQANGSHVDARADQYSLGCILYQMLSGVPPFTADDLMGYLFQHGFQPPPPLRSHSLKFKIPEGLEALVMRLLEKQPGKRYAGMREVVDALDDQIDLLTGHRRAPSPATGGSQRLLLFGGIGIGTVVLLGILGIWWRSREPQPERRKAQRDMAAATSLAAATPSRALDASGKTEATTAEGPGKNSATDKSTATTNPPRRLGSARTSETEKAGPKRGGAAPTQSAKTPTPLLVHFVIEQPKDVNVVAKCGAKTKTCNGACDISIPPGEECQFHFFGFIDQVHKYEALRGLPRNSTGAATKTISLMPRM